MTTIRITHDRAEPAFARAGTKELRALLACGLISSLLYLITDFLGGLRYQGYSFASQAISELGAVGAPSKAFVDPLFAGYDLLAVAFGIAVVRAGAIRMSRALRVAGYALAAHGALGFVAAITGPFFSMRVRGAGSLTTDAPHIALTGVIVLLLLIAILSGAFTLGKRFRQYSLLTLSTVVVFGALTIPFAPHVAAGVATPGLGIFERINVYSTMAWIAVLSVALLRRDDAAEGWPGLG